MYQKLKFCVFFVSFLTSQMPAQGLKGILNNGAEQAKREVQKTVERKINQQTSTNPASNIDFKTYTQRNDSQRINTKSTKLADNLLLNISGNYPKNYNPYWKNINGYPSMTFHFKNFLVKRDVEVTAVKRLGLGNYQGKAALVFSQGVSDCICFLSVSNKQALLSDTFQTFDLKDFQIIKNEVATGAPCQSSDTHTQGGWNGKINLRADIFGNIDYELLLENFNPGIGSKALGNISYRYWLSDKMKNEVTPDKAMELVRLRKLRKTNDSLGKIESTRQQAEKRKDFEFSIKNSYSKTVALQAKFKPFNPECVLYDELSVYIPGNKTYSPIPIYVGNEIIDVQFREEGSEGHSYTQKIWRNTCNETVTIKGIYKGKSDLGTVYYADNSYTLAPGEYLDFNPEIEKSYNKDSAAIDSVHYYQNSLKK